ncbi:TetR/AcrR family transcriptional regulator [Conexibacter sp. JD483]|uniref:TetR/AcrR family transcriptional regulator n=1 Tax=unclassified Conexibacter TaxID=2627773 RepID=UPI00271E66B0|nr:MULTISPECIES: TetR/AcrR family transcriptional regulator [unclassified Conexibacter]MDO8188512.1 TetR/AcrR family transcriptional regulator [Conexibacter sp. CPCC 205706]MDO8200144.1 TetR/AcrR family transcriptional regulator [Conexibacter sp. CPCC 205762]MDR9371183.1 TetR/AcrR family transcriptional regulator [Conexibacter sp. JD483]
MRLQRMHGVAGTAFADVLADSGAPRGSVYHHFPDGRAQLAAAATEHGADWIAGQLEQLLAAGDPLRALDGFIELWAGIVREEQYMAGCAVAAGALDSTPGSAARRAAAAGFSRWERILTDAFAAHVPVAQAEGLAVTCIAAVEGALILVRAEGTLRPLERVAEQLRQLLVATQQTDPASDGTASRPR